MTEMGPEVLKSQKSGNLEPKRCRFDLYYKKKKTPRASLRSPTTENMEKKKMKKKKEKKT